MRSIAKKGIAILLAIVMLMSIGTFPAMAEEKEIYYFIGDSMSFDFTGRYDLYEPTYIYAKQAGDALGLEVTEACAIPGGRFTDVYAMMSDYDGDEYTWDERGGWISDKTMRANYIKSIGEADYLSVQIGYSGVSMFMIKNMLSVIQGDGPLYNTDVSQIFEYAGENAEKLIAAAEKCAELVKKTVGEDSIKALEQYVSEFTDSQKKAVGKLLGGTSDSLDGATDIVNELTRTLVYTILGHFVFFDRTVERIYEINPDVELYIMSLANPLQHFKLSFEVSGRRFTIDIGDLLGGVYDIMNMYTRVLSPYSDKYYYVENLESIDNYGQAMARDEEMSRRILFTYYNGEHYTGYGEDTECEAYKKADSLAHGVMKALSNTTDIDLNKLIASVPSDTSTISTDFEVYLDKLSELDENGEPTASYFEQMMAHIFLVSFMIGVYAHPTQEVHDAEAQIMIKALQEKQISPAGIAYHKLTKPIESFMSIVEKGSSTVDTLKAWTQKLASDAQTQDGGISFGFVNTQPSSAFPTIMRVISDFVGFIRNAMEMIGDFFMQSDKYFA